MFKLKIGYLITGIITGLILLVSFIQTIPDGKLHIVFCAVGQGDGVYVQFPDGRAMVIDGGPTQTSMVNCLSRHMPFWQRSLALAILTHPDKDHMNGLLEVLSRYHVAHVVRSDVTTSTEGFQTLQQRIQSRHITEKLVEAGAYIKIGAVQLSLLWPTRQELALFHRSGTVLGATTEDTNRGSVVFKLSYGTFDALFTGDADATVDEALVREIPDDSDGLEVLKVPHHGSKTGMSDRFFSVLSPTQDAVAVISVGKNAYGHPAPEIVEKLEKTGFLVLRTDKNGDIELISDGNGWEIKKEH